MDTNVYSEFGKNSTIKPYKKGYGSHVGKSGQSTGEFDGSNTNNFS